MTDTRPDSGRKYTTTHPWLTFSIDLTKASPRLWMLLGEAASKCEHIAGVPLDQATAQKLHQLYLAKGVHATTAIEGNTLTEQQVLERVEGKLHLPESQEYLQREIDNILAVCNKVCDEVRAGRRTWALTVETFCEFNLQVLDGLELEETVVPGEVRTHSVGVGRYRGAPWEDCPRLLELLCEWLNGPQFRPPEGMKIRYAILKAILAHVYLAWIHAFGDGNGRTARMVEFQVLVSSGVPTPAAHLLSNHYNETRSEYYRQLERTSRGGDLLGFLEYALVGFVDGLRGQLGLIRGYQWDLSWRNFVEQCFRGQTSPSALRRKQLVLDLSSRDAPVLRGELRMLTPQLAASYAGKTDKTLTRDLNARPVVDLIERGPGGYRARREMLLAFLPLRVD